MFLSKFGCYGNSLGSLENLDSIFEIADSENPTIHAKTVSISCTEMKSVQFLLIFAQIWLPWQLHWLGTVQPVFQTVDVNVAEATVAV